MRKVIDDKGRLFGKVSVIDIIVVAVVAVLVVAYYTKFNVGDLPMSSSDTVEVTYTMRIAGIRMSSAGLLRLGDRFFATETGTYMGYISNIHITEAEAADTLVDGSYVVAPVEERYDVTLTIEADCSISNGRYYLDKTIELSANCVYRAYTKYNDFFTVLVTEITVPE